MNGLGWKSPRAAGMGRVRHANFGGAGLKAISHCRRLFLLLLLVLVPHLPAVAAVEIAFYSRELGGNNFPHAFVHLTGTIDATGQPVDTALGFTAKTVTPAVLLGSVAGEVIVETPNQIARSDRQFSLVITDQQYGAVLEVVERWRNRAQPSYNLNRRNCVHFVGEIAAALGLRIDGAERLMKKPRSFLLHVRELNPRLTVAVR